MMIGDWLRESLSINGLRNDWPCYEHAASANWCSQGDTNNPLKVKPACIVISE